MSKSPTIIDRYIMNNMYLMVLFLFVITSTSIVSSSSFSNEHDIFTIKDDQISTMHPVRSGMTKVIDNGVQIGRFDIGDGKILTLSRPAKIGIKCIYLSQPCGALDWCCEGLRCTGFLNGECRNDASCKKRDEKCDLLDICCKPYYCDTNYPGHCR